MRVEKKDGFLGFKQRAQNTFVEGSAPGKILGQRGILQARFARENWKVSLGERSETIKAVEALDNRKESIDRNGNLAVRQNTCP